MGGLAATVVEYVLHFIYQEILGVSIWNYSNLPYNINGRVCLMFTVFWSILSMGLVYFIHPLVEKRMAAMPKTLFAVLLLFVGMDAHDPARCYIKGLEISRRSACRGCFQIIVISLAERPQFHLPFSY